MIVGFLLWLGILIWLATSIWGGIIWAVLWLFIGGGTIALIVGLLSLPTRLFGAGMVVLGERLTGENEEGLTGLGYCAACGSNRGSDDDQFCRSCGAPYG